MLFPRLPDLTVPWQQVPTAGLLASRADLMSGNQAFQPARKPAKFAAPVLFFIGLSI
jgi:hypothetical protein